MAGMLRVPRTRGALSGVLLVLLGVWGGLVPLVGPYFDFGFAPDKTWALTSGQVLLQIAPAAAAFLGGLITFFSANRAVASFGAWLAALGGAWFVVGVPLSGLWSTHTSTAVLGGPLGGTSRQAIEQVSMLYGLGAAILFFGTLALGRFAVVGLREAQMTGLVEPARTTEPVGPEATRPGPIQRNRPEPGRTEPPLVDKEGRRTDHPSTGP